MNKMRSKTKLKPIHFLETILQIIEEKTINYPRVIYCLMIVILYSHYAGYIFSTYEAKPLLDPKMVFVAHWNEYSPGTFLLYVASQDQITIVALCLMHSILLFYIFYIFILTIIRVLYPEILIYLGFFTKIFNGFYQIFFSSFLWILYIPFTEIHAGSMVIGGNSFFTAYREVQDYSQKPFILIFVGALGISLTFFTGVILAYCYISYDFYEKNLLKRSFRFNLVIQLIARTFMVTLYYLNINNIVIVKYCIGNLLGLTALYDFFKYVPFRDDFICIFYGCSTIIYEYMIILFTVWGMTDVLPEYNMFFVWVVPSSFLVVAIGVFYKSKYFRILKLHPLNVDNGVIDRVDLFLEIIYELTISSQSDKIKKLKLLGLMDQFFKNPVKGMKIFENLKFRKILKENFEIDEKIIIAILNELFQIFLSDKSVKSHQDIYENILMKYCTFLSHYQNNPIKAYYELKKLLFASHKSDNDRNNKKGNNEPSVIFTIVSNLVSEQIEEMIAEVFVYKYNIILDTKQKNKYKKIEKKQDSKLNLTFLPRTNEIRHVTIQEFIKVLKLKIAFYEKLLIGFSSLESVQKEGFALVSAIKRLKSAFEDRIQKLSHETWKENTVILKLQSIFLRLILNDRLSSWSIEGKIKEIMKKDALILNSTSKSSILQAKTVILSISLLNEGGIISNRLTHKIAEFFGYELVELQNIRTIHKLMPVSLGEIHQNLVDRFLKKGPGKVFNIERAVYCVNKQNFIFPISLQLTLSFFIERDYCVSGLLTKIQSSSMDCIFNCNGKIIGMTENFVKEMPDLYKITMNDLYEKYDIYYFIPDLLEKLPSEESIEKYIHKREWIVDIFQGKVLPFFIVNNFQNVFKNLHSYKSKFNDQNQNKKYYRRFLMSVSNKTLLIKKLVQFNLRLELFPTKNKQYLKIFILQIKGFLSDNDIENLYSYTSGLTNSTQTLSNTYRSTQTVKSSDKNIDSEKKIKEITQNNNEKLQDIIGYGLKKTYAIEESSAMIDKEREIEEKKLDELELKLSNSSNSFEKKKVHTNSEDTNKLIMSDDNQKTKEKASSLHSNRVSSKYFSGQALLKEIVANKKPNRILKKILILSLFQIIFFFSVNILYQVLVNERIATFMNHFQDIDNNLMFSNNFYKVSYFSEIYFLNEKGVIDQNALNENDNYIKSLLEDAYNQMRSIDWNNVMEKNSYKINASLFFEQGDGNQIVTAQPLEITNLFLLISSFSKEFLLQNQNFYNLVSFFRGNLLKYILMEREFLANNMNEFENLHKDLINFYLYLSIIAVICGFCLQILSFPFIRTYLVCLEKIYALSTRLQEKECEIEILKLKTALNRLESANEQYLNYDFDKLDEIKLSIRANNENEPVKTKSKKSYHVSYLSSKIFNNKLSFQKNYIFFFISIFIVGIYYTGIFIYIIELQSILDTSLNIINFTNVYYTNLNKIDLLRMIVLGHNSLNETYSINDRDIQIISQEMQEIIRNLKEANYDKMNQDLPNKLGDIYTSYKNLLINDLCEYGNNQDICSNFQLPNLAYGIQGYASYLYNHIIQNDYLYNSSNPNYTIPDEQTLKRNILSESNLNETLKNFELINIALTELLNECESIFKTLTTNLDEGMIWLLLIGGLGCSMIWLLLNIIRYKQMQNEMNSSKEMLRLIPLEKLNDEATIHLLKIIDSF